MIVLLVMMVRIMMILVLLLFWGQCGGGNGGDDGGIPWFGECVVNLVDILNVDTGVGSGAGVIKNIHYKQNSYKFLEHLL